MSLPSIPTLVTATISLFLGLFVIGKNKKASLNWSFAVWCFLTFYWQACWTLLFNVRNEETALLLARLGYSGIIFIPIVFFHFVVAFTQDTKSRRLSYLFYALGVTFLVLNWGTDSFVAGIYTYAWGFYPRAGTFHVVYVGFLLIMLSTGLYTLLQFRKKLAGQPLKINQVNYILSSTVIYSLAGVDFLANYGIGYYPIGFVFTNVHAGIITYAIIQYRLLDINIILKRSLIYTLILMGMLVPCYLIVIAGQGIAFKTINYVYSLVVLCLLVVVGFLFPKLRFKTEDALERVLFKKRTDYRETLLRSSREMVSVVDLMALSESLVQTIGRALGVEKVSLFLLNEIKGTYNSVAWRGPDENNLKMDIMTKADPLVGWLSEHREPTVKEELEMARDGAERERTARRMGQLDAEISLPIISKDKLIGILNLGHKEEKDIYSSEDLELLSTLANQAAIAIENARLYENLKQSQDTLRRADRLSSLGLLTAGLAHEIRNPLVAIRTFTQLLPERYDDADFREGFQGLALKEVDRICGLINDLLSFARPSRPNVAEENMNDVVDGIARILETEAKEKGVEITRDFARNLPGVWIDREQMKQVFMNLILNAIQAMGEGGSIFIATRLASRNDPGHAGQFVQVEVRDTGLGIPPENLDHIFDPFFTSKEEGSGLGLSISHQIVQEHGGYVTVESKVGSGTTFFINLPVGKPIRRLSNGHAHANQANLSH
jgi:two-component system, NtrC family, sensor kinase